MTQSDIRRPVVAGAGTMGTTLARIFAQHGFAVTLWNRRTPSLERAQARIAGDLDRLAAQGLLTEDPAAIAGGWPTPPTTPPLTGRTSWWRTSPRTWR